MKLPVPRRAGLAAVLFFFALAALALVAIPPLKSRVTDLTGTLSVDQRKSLEERLAALEARKGSQVAVLIVPTTQPEAIEQYAIRVAEQWKVGRKGVDDGAIVLVALKDRAVRIETGYGLEGALPDAVAKRIVDEHIVPRFKAGDYYGGLDAGISRILSVIDGEPLPAPRGAPGAPGASGGRGSGGAGFEQFLIVAFLLIFGIGGIIRAMFGRFLGSGAIAAIGGVAGWLMLGSIIAAIVVAVIAMLLSLMGGLGGMGGLGSRRGGGWSGGFPGGGGWSGGGGSWGGGGGGFGGGGASGRW